MDPTRIANRWLLQAQRRLGPDAKKPSEADLRVGDWVVAALNPKGVDWGRIDAMRFDELSIMWRFGQFRGTCADDTVREVLRMPSETAAEALAEEIDSTL